MDQPIDIIAVMNRGVPYASRVFEYYKKQGKDVRFLAFYPVLITLKDFKKDASGPWIEVEQERSIHKLNSYKKGYHNKLKEYLEAKKTITDNEIRAFEKKDFSFRTWESSKYTLEEGKWGYLLNSLEDKIYEVSEEDFIKNPAIRLSAHADPNRKAIACDDYIYELNTALFTIYDLFRLGYKDVEFQSKLSKYDTSLLHGNLSIFNSKYKDKSFSILERDIFEEFI